MQLKFLLPFLFLTLCLLPPITHATETASTPPQLAILNHVNTKEKVVALTFDADMTPHMLNRLQKHKVATWYNKAVIDELKKENVPATLFLTGMWIETYSTTTRELSDDPLFEIGNHSYSHGGFSTPCFNLRSISESQDADEVNKTEALLSKYAAKHVKLFRFPGLCYDKDDLTTVNASGYTAVDSDVHGVDGFQKEAHKIVTNIIDNVKPGSIIALHMHGGPNAPETAAALPIIIEKLKGEGYTFVKVSELLKYK